MDPPNRPCRRCFLRLAVSAGLLAAAAPFAVFAAEGAAQAMLLSSIDPRMIAPVYI
jgi:hypothetical protein